MNLCVAIPSYNKEKYIRRCLDSILKEKDYISEIILVDNNSSDRTFEIAKEYETKIKCYRNEKNLGMSGNWNRCINLCNSEWLMIFHADDEMLPNAISEYAAFIKNNPSVGLIHGNSFGTVDGVIKNSGAPLRERQVWKAGAEALTCEYGVCSAVMVKKSAYERLGYFIDNSLSSDVEMWARIAGKYDVGYINKPTVIYHLNSSSTGPSSLVKRSVWEIKSDWDDLAKRIAGAYPTKESGDEYLRKNLKMAPLNYWAVFRENIKAKNYWNAIQAAFLIVFIYGGLRPFLTKIGQVISKKIIAQ